MKQIIKIFGIIFGCIIILSIIVAIFSPDPKSQNTSTHPEPFNKDAVFASIKQDSLWSVKTLELDKDSILHITLGIRDTPDNTTPQYFDNTYKLIESGAIQEIEIDKSKKLVYTYGLKTGKIVDAFKENAMVGNECYPVRETIKKSLNDPDSYDFVDGGYSYEGNDVFDVWLTFRAKNGFNATITSKAIAKVTSDGTVLSYEVEQ